MNFTPQQLVGGQSYSSKTRIGNWGEDNESVDTLMKDYVEKKEYDSLAS